jgi:hypothetical protein
VIGIAGDFDVLECDQGTPEWLLARCGRVTGSRAKDMMATIKSGEAAPRRDYRLQLVCERLTGQPQDDQFVSADMKRGTELEPAARAAYESATGLMVTQTGFLSHRTMHCGASLDGHVGNFVGLVELKVPRPATHLKYLRAGILPTEHRWQLVHNLFVTNAEWADFVSYCPAMPEPLQLFTVRLSIDDVDMTAYQLALSLFLSEVEKELDSIVAMVAA